MEFVKPSDEEVSILAEKRESTDGLITPYAVWKQLNEWLIADGLEPISSQRVYNQFTKMAEKSERVGSRLTPKGAQQVIERAYSYLKLNS